MSDDAEVEEDVAQPFLALEVFLEDGQDDGATTSALTLPLAIDLLNQVGVILAVIDPCLNLRPLPLLAVTRKRNSPDARDFPGSPATVNLCKFV